MRRGLVLFTRDLRVRDHPALAAAARECDEIVPLFVLDRELLGGSCGAPSRLAFLLASLHDLDASLRERGSRLVVRHGDVVKEAIALARRFDARAIYMSADASPYARGRASRLATACEGERIALRCRGGITVVPPGELTPLGGDHYRVFTPYWRVWRRHVLAPSPRAPRSLRAPEGMPATAIPELRSLTRAAPAPQLPEGGESAGRRALQRWLGGPLARYGSLHDDLATAGTSQLSPYLHFGCLAAQAVLERAEARGPRAAGGSTGEGAGGAHEAAEDFARQLCWRDFHHQVLAARPDLPRADYRPRGDRWRRDEDAAQAWRAGLTGYPIVDAGMRQLAQEGFMHNRARLIVASFLTKILYIDWRIGAAHFARLLSDADVANNVGNWQWVAGTGNDTRPNRVLNPLRQAARFDPHGDYVRRHVPELAGLPGAAVHRPWLLAPKARRALAYPDPIADHAEAAARLRRLRGGAG